MPTTASPKPTTKMEALSVALDAHLGGDRTRWTGKLAAEGAREALRRAVAPDMPVDMWAAYVSGALRIETPVHGGLRMLWAGGRSRLAERFWSSATGWEGRFTGRRLHGHPRAWGDISPTSRMLLVAAWSERNEPIKPLVADLDHVTTSRKGQPLVLNQD